MSFRHSIDITPWSKEGRSSFGLRRKNAKILALFFLVFGALLADPPGGLLPNDIFNFFVANQLTKIGFEFKFALLLSYSVIGWGLILWGAYIYPYNTRLLLNGYANKFKKAIKKVLTNPIFLFISILSFYIMFKLYSKVLGGV